MKPIFTLVFALHFPLAAFATNGPDTPDTGQDIPSLAADTTAGDDAAETLLFLDAREIDARDFIWVNRMIVVMADTPNDPQLERQLNELRERASEFLARDAVVIFDAHPQDRSPLRQVLRPSGFVTAIIDKDGEVKARRPAVRTGREFMAIIDRFPSRRQEMLERLPAGR